MQMNSEGIGWADWMERGINIIKLPMEADMDEFSVGHFQ